MRSYGIFRYRCVPDSSNTMLHFPSPGTHQPIYRCCLTALLTELEGTTPSRAAGLSGEALVRAIFRSLCGNAGMIMVPKRRRDFVSVAETHTAYRASKSRFLVDRGLETDARSWFANLAYAIQSLCAQLDLPLRLSNTDQGRTEYSIDVARDTPYRTIFLRGRYAMFQWCREH